MKSRITIILIGLAVFTSAAHAQSNCCEIQVGGVSITGGIFTVPPSSTPPNNGPGGTYIPEQTNTHGIACFNPETNRACNLASTSPNVVLAKGYGANFNGSFKACVQTFQTTTVQKHYIWRGRQLYG